MDEEKQQKEACEKCVEYLGGWKRALADYDNLKKDLAKERQSSRESGMEQMALIAMEALDHLSKALEQKPQDTEGSIDGWIRGIDHIKDQIEGSLEQKGFFRMRLEPGQLFDPQLHHAVGEQSEEGAVSGAILQVLQDGWKRNDHIVRPAMVIIAK